VMPPTAYTIPAVNPAMASSSDALRLIAISVCP
jgi:hypothetical protein